MAIALPFTFINGTVADATQVNANFSALSQDALVSDPSGSLTLGTPALSPAPSANSIVSDQLIVRASTTGASLPGDYSASLFLNVYEDASNVLRYAANGGAGSIATHNITAGIAESRVTFGVSDVNTAGPGASVASFIGAMHICAGVPGNLAPFVVIGTQGDVPVAPARRSTFIVGQLVARADPITTGADDISRIFFNQYFDNTGTARYVENGPSANMTMHTGYFQIALSDPGTAGSPLPLSPPGTSVPFRLRPDSAIGAGQTALEINVSNNAGLNRPQVTLGAPDSGGTGFRTLIVPN